MFFDSPPTRQQQFLPTILVISVLLQSAPQLDSVDDDQEKERISVEEANRPLSVPKDGFTFEALIKNREEVEHFKEFLGKKHAKGKKSQPLESEKLLP